MDCHGFFILYFLLSKTEYGFLWYVCSILCLEFTDCLKTARRPTLPYYFSTGPWSCWDLRLMVSNKVWIAMIRLPVSYALILSFGLQGIVCKSFPASNVGRLFRRKALLTGGAIWFLSAGFLRDCGQCQMKHGLRRAVRITCFGFFIGIRSWRVYALFSAVPEAPQVMGGLKTGTVAPNHSRKSCQPKWPARPCSIGRLRTSIKTSYPAATLPSVSRPTSYAE